MSPGFLEFKPNDDSDEEDSGYSPGTPYRGTFVGTPLYVAPEMLKAQISGHFTDLWALGCIVYEMAFGFAPFRGESEFSTFDMIMNKDMKFPSGANPDLVDLINKLLVIEPM